MDKEIDPNRTGETTSAADDEQTTEIAGQPADQIADGSGNDTTDAADDTASGGPA